MKLIILGATGKTGRLLVKQAVTAGHDVTAFVRNPERLLFKNPKLRIIAGDARCQTDLTAALVGQDVVLNVVGSTKATDELALRSTVALIKAAQQTSVRRIITLSTFLLAPHIKLDIVAKLARRALNKSLADRIAGDKLLEQSDLDWTLIYATALDRAPAGNTVRIVGQNEVIGIRNGIARADVADFMLKQLAESKTIRCSMVITTK